MRARSGSPWATSHLPWAMSSPRLALSHRLGLERNALRRGTDRAEAAVAVALLLAFVVSAPLLALLTTRSTYDAGVGAEGTGGERVIARLTSPAPEPRLAPFDQSGPPPRTKATATWSYDEIAHTGQVRVLAGSPVGTPVAVWVDPSGDLTEPPQSHTWTLGLTALAGAGSVVGPAMVVWAVWRVVRSGLVQRQLPVWEAEWAAVEPEWTRRG